MNRGGGNVVCKSHRPVNPFVGVGLTGDQSDGSGSSDYPQWPVATKMRKTTALDLWKLASTQSFGPWRFSPTVTLNYAEEKPAGTAAATGTHDALAARATGAGRIDVTPEVAYRIEMPQAMFIEPKAAIGSFWDIDALSKLAPRSTAHEDMRLKAGAGVTIGSIDGTKLEVGGGVEGGGPATPDVWTGRLQLSVPLK